MKFVQASNIYLNEKEDSKKFDELLEYCRRKEVKVLFLVGNVFDGEPTEEFLSSTDEKLKTFDDLRVFIVLGKTDGSYAAYVNHKFKSNVTFFAGNCIQRVYIARWNVEITGVSYDGTTWGKVHPELIHRGKKGGYQVFLLPFLGSDDETLDETYKDLTTEFDYMGIGLKEPLKLEQQKIYSPGAFGSVNEFERSELRIISGNLDSESGTDLKLTTLQEENQLEDRRDLDEQFKEVVPPEGPTVEADKQLPETEATEKPAADSGEEKTAEAPQDKSLTESFDLQTCSEEERRLYLLLETEPGSELREKALEYGLRSLRETEEK